MPLVRWTLGILLLTAAVLKFSHGFSQELGEVHGSLCSHAVSIRLVPCSEILLGLWLISGIQTTLSFVAAAATFGCFAAFTLWEIWHGITDCGCFGRIALQPKVTYWIDIGALTACFMALRPRRPRIFLPVILLATPAIYFAVLWNGRVLPSRQSSPSGLGIVAGKPWPPAGAVGINADLAHGRWIILIYSSGCGHCQSLAADYSEAAREWPARGIKTRLALLDAGASTDAEATVRHSGIVHGALIQTDLYHHTPILLLLVDGRVMAIQGGWEAADFSRPPNDHWIQ